MTLLSSFNFATNPKLHGFLLTGFLWMGVGGGVCACICIKEENILSLSLLVCDNLLTPKG